MPTLQFFGSLRDRAGTDHVIVDAHTLSQVLQEAEKRLPDLRGYLIDSVGEGKPYRVNLNGRQFINDPEHTVTSEDELTLVGVVGQP